MVLEPITKRKTGKGRLSVWNTRLLSTKSKHLLLKTNTRHIEQEKRKDYTKKDQQIHHTYRGSDDEPEIRRKVKECECSGTDHVRKTYHKCPLNPLNALSTSRQALISQSAECNEDMCSQNQRTVMHIMMSLR